ncbi:MAG TPA: PIN domain-containing protein [Bauldia sp.]
MVVAVDSSTLIAFIQGDQGADVENLDASLGNVALPPIVLSELLSEPKLPPRYREMILDFPLLELQPDYWLRAAGSRGIILARKLRARLSDTLIAQSCIDHDVALITRDKDFRHFAKHCGLKLA